jgi:hypothetical protein
MQRMARCSVAMFKMYLTVLYQKSSLVIAPVTIVREPLACYNDQVLPYVIVCLNCYTIRSQIHGVHRKRHANDGTITCINGFGSRCFGCKSTRVRLVDLRLYRVTGLSVNSTEEVKTVTMCQGCGKCTLYQYVIGGRELCGICYRSAMETILPRRCICGVPFTTKNKVSKTFIALSKDRVSTLYALCDKHASVLDHAVGPRHHIGFYTRLVSDKRTLTDYKSNTKK